MLTIGHHWTSEHWISEHWAEMGILNIEALHGMIAGLREIIEWVIGIRAT